MKNKNKNWVWVIVSVVGIASLIIFNFSSKNLPVVSSPMSGSAILSITREEVEEVRSGIPIRLKIPSLEIDAFVEPVGLTDLGAMGVPTGPDTVAWFNLGFRPGEIGSAVIDGHSGYKNNKPGVFDNLYALKKGDNIHIEDEKGTTTTFVVREIKKYNRDATAPNVFTSSDGKAHLNLITCTGDWDQVEKIHSKRLVVFSEKI